MQHTKYIGGILLLTLSQLATAQMGIGNMKPRGALDINDSAGINKHGLVLPTNADPETNISNPISKKEVVPGTIVYDSAKDCIRYYQNGAFDGDSVKHWSPCLALKIEPPPPPVTKTIHIGFMGAYPIGDNSVSAFNSQLTNLDNYGPSGTYEVTKAITFENVSSDINSLNATQLKTKYSILNISTIELSETNAQKVLDYVNQGGVLIANFDINIGGVLFRKFGGTGSVGTVSGLLTMSVNNHEINNGIFGDVRNAPSIINTSPSGTVQSSQLPAGAEILATAPGTVATFVTGTEGRAIFIFDELPYLASGTIIDTNQEKYLHNIIAYAIDKADSI